MKAKFLTLEERKEIERLLKLNKNYAQIATALRRSPETIRQELIKYGKNKIYTADEAHKSCQEKIALRGQLRSHFTFEEKKKIELLLSQHVSCNKIAEILGRSQRGISREVKLNSLNGVYSAENSYRVMYRRNLEKRTKKTPIQIENDYRQLNFLEEEINNLSCNKSATIEDKQQDMNIYKEFEEKIEKLTNKIELLEMQIDILHDTIKELKNEP